jgi:Type III secretion system, cytoplasmic E component of needle
MSMPHEMNPANALLGQILKQDSSGTALRELLDQLATSDKEVEASLDQPHTAAEQEVLQQLADAIRLGDTVLQRLWVMRHKRPVVL